LCELLFIPVRIERVTTVDKEGLADHFGREKVRGVVQYEGALQRYQDTVCGPQCFSNLHDREEIENYNDSKVALFALDGEEIIAAVYGNWDDESEVHKEEVDIYDQEWDDPKVYDRKGREPADWNGFDEEVDDGEVWIKEEPKEAVVEIDTGPVGRIKTAKGDHWTVGSLCVAKLYRRGGLATKMMRRLIRDMRAKHNSCIILIINSVGEEAAFHDILYDFYGSFGFEMLIADGRMFDHGASVKKIDVFRRCMTYVVLKPDPQNLADLGSSCIA